MKPRVGHAGMKLSATLLVAFGLTVFGAYVAPWLAKAAFAGLNGKIAFASNRDGNSEIYTMNPDGSDQTRLTNNSFFDVEPAWSPDGRRLVFLTARGLPNFSLYTMAEDGTDERMLVQEVFGSKPAWSPDGKAIAFTTRRQAIAVVKLDNPGHIKKLTPGPGDYDPVWSPDGSQIAFTRVGGPPDKNVIYLMNPDGTNVRKLTSGAYDDFSPDWSPAGSELVFTRFFGGRDYRIVKMNVSTLQETELTHPDTAETSPVWAPDHTRIAFRRGLDTPQIFTMAADGSDVTQLTTTGGNAPDWQPRSVELPPPSTVVKEKGTVRSGDVSSLSFDDNDYYEVDAAGRRRSSVRWFATFQASNETHAFNVTYVGKNSLDCVLKLSLFDWTRATWATVSSQTVGANEELVRDLVLAATGDYVSGSSGSGEMRVRMSCARMDSLPFTSSADMLAVSYFPLDP
jgi:Tol biopolymer transport system component